MSEEQKSEEQQKEQQQQQVSAEGEAPPVPGQRAITIGTAIPSTTTIDAICTAMFATRANLPGSITYRYSDFNIVQGYFSDGSMITARFESRPCPPSVLSW